MAALDFFRRWRNHDEPTTSAALQTVAMSLIDGPQQPQALEVHPSDPQAGRFSHATYRMVSDMRVNPDTATQVAAIWCCMDVIASALSSSDWNVYGGVRGEANKQALPRDPLQYILNTRFNPEMTAQAGKRALGLAASGWGNGIAEIEWDGAGRIKGLWPIAPHRIEPRRDLTNLQLFYRVTQEYRGGWVDIDPENLYIVRGPSMVGFSGDNTLARAVRTVAIALSVDQFVESYFGNHAQLGTVFMYKGGSMNDVNYTRAKESLEAKHRGVKKAYSTGMFTGDWDIKTFGSNMEQSLFQEVKNATVSDICRIFHMPPHKIAQLDKSTNNNIEHQGLEFSRDTMRPWVQEIQQESDYKLIPFRGPDRFIELDMDWAEQGDYKSRMEAYAIGRNMGVLSGNDVLRKLGENTIGEDGDIRIVQGANVRLEDVGAAYAQPGAAPADKVTQAWLTTTYARIARRTAAGGKPKDVAAFARELVNDMADPLGSRLARAHEVAQLVVGGADPVGAAESVITEATV